MLDMVRIGDVIPTLDYIAHSIYIPYDILHVHKLLSPGTSRLRIFTYNNMYYLRKPIIFWPIVKVSDPPGGNERIFGRSTYSVLRTPYSVHQSIKGIWIILT
jgi:hypothetical protein